MIVKTIRDYLDGNGFTEIDTPVLTNKATGALARPFLTHYNALDIDIYLRIAPETYLKRAIAGGFDRVYEFARSFRNEGVDASHLPDFTLLEYYCAYWNYVDNMNFTEALFKHLLQVVNGGLKLTYENTVIDFDGFQVHMDPDSTEATEEATVDFVDGVSGSGFKIDRPRTCLPDSTAPWSSASCASLTSRSTPRWPHMVAVSPSSM